MASLCVVRNALVPFVLFAFLIPFALAAGACGGNSSEPPTPDAGELGIQRTPHPPVPVVAVAPGSVHTCMLHADGRVSCVGADYGGQFGDGRRSPELELHPVFVPNVAGAVEIVSGENHACARLASGRVACWGANDRGQMGLGPNASIDAPAASGQEVLALANVVGISSGYLHMCATTADGTAYCWGGNRAGRLGDGTADDRSTPVAVKTLANVAEIAAGNFHTCARLRDGTVACWGSNDFGQLGDGTITPTRLPVAAFGLANAVQLAAGAYHVCARLVDGHVACWGEGAYGAIGDGGGVDRKAPVIVPNLDHVADVAAGFRHTCVRLEDSTVRCWGDNGSGQTSVSRLKPVMQPVVVPGMTGVTHVKLGMKHSCAVKNGGTDASEVWCWGSNADAQLGDGNRGNAFPAPGAVLW
jgi:alpha-tubulin suppressor-like RCC1 family protein